MSPEVSEQAWRAVESTARESYGRLVAFLSARTRDVAGAEDALSEALLAALATWPRDGIPANPQAWLFSAARNRLIDQARRRRVRREAEPTLALMIDTGEEDLRLSEPIPDERLKLLFVCAHPAIDPDIHTPLMLQTVLGFDAAQISRAFLVSPATMGQRLVRAKTKIRRAGIAFEVPEAPQLPQRLQSVLDAIYAAYGSGWEDAAGVDPRTRGLADESIWLARVLVQLMPDEPEARGLLALMLHCESRRQVRRRDGRFVPLSEQDPRRWLGAMIDEAERELACASCMRKPGGLHWPGRYQIEAAIQSVHAERARTGRTDWRAIAMFYRQLVHVSPTLGAQVGLAAAVAENEGAAAGLELLECIASDRVVTYQPYWAVRAHLLKRLRGREAAVASFERAIGLAEDAAIREYLLEQRG